MIRLNKTNSYKIGLNEVKGLERAMRDVLKPVQAELSKSIYWNDVGLEQVEYISRDGFIAYSSNCGGLRILEIIPKCEEYSFDYLEFGEHDDDCDLNKPEGDCTCGEDDGFLDAKLEIFLKFEGIDEKGTMSFYLVLHGGNQDAPYFGQSTDIFETEFKARNIAEFRTKAKKAITKLLKVIS